ncbi:MAG: metallophosphoesterase, partial [Myxococcota bacterium]
QPLPAPDQPVKLLLTSDQQNRAMSPANFEKVVETVGKVDAVLFAGDFVDTPNRASEWFDRGDVRRPAFFPAIQGRFQEMFPDHPYRGGEVLQHAPVFGTIGNHESPGRFRPNVSIGGMDGEPRPRWFAAWQWDELSDAERALTGVTRDEFIRDNSFEHLTYYEMWSLPTNDVMNEEPENFYALRYGNVHITSMNVSRVWRNWNNGFTNGGRGKFSEPSTTVNDIDTWGFGDMFFQDFGPGSAQRAWLALQLQSPDYTGAAYKVVLGHQTMFGQGDNAVPVMANPEATIRFTDNRTPVVTTFPTDASTWTQIVEAARLGLIESVWYQYRRADDLWLGVEAELLQAGAHLVHTGHSHTWNRSYVDAATGHRLNYIETSNVGNTFGPSASYNPRVPWAREFYPDPMSDMTRDPSFWDPSDYARIGDPHGRPDVTPSRSPEVDVMRDIEGAAEGLPFISSNRITVFTILDSSDGSVRSYAHDTQYPRSRAIEVDCFPLDASQIPDPC